jgi:hypothetical protein
MNAVDLRPVTRPVRRPSHAVDRMPAVAPVAAGMLVICALVLFEHARRLLDATTLAEETLGLAALPPLRHEVPAAVLEAFVGCGLLIAAFALLRRSRVALVFATAVQVVVALDALLRIVRGLTLLPAVALLVLAALTSGTVLARRTRAWCDAPLWPPNPANPQGA